MSQCHTVKGFIVDVSDTSITSKDGKITRRSTITFDPLGSGEKAHVDLWARQLEKGLDLKIKNDFLCKYCEISVTQGIYNGEINNTYDGIELPHLVTPPVLPYHVVPIKQSTN